MNKFEILETKETEKTEETLTGLDLIMTKYEKARILGLRALQIDMNSPLLVDPKGETDPLRIALMELRARKLPYKIRRIYPDGTNKDISINKLIVP